MSEQLSCYGVALLIGMFEAMANWWISGLRSLPEREQQREKEKASDKWSRGETVRRCQAGSCPHSVTHLPPQTGCSQELPATSPRFLFSHILLQRQVSSLHMPLLFEIRRSRARCCWKERKEKKCSASCVDIAVAGVTARLPRRHLGSAIVTTVDTASPCSPLK